MVFCGRKAESLKRMKTILEILRLFFHHVMLWNMIFAIIIVFFERRDPKSVWGWLLLLFLLPGIGFPLYLFLGIRLHRHSLSRTRKAVDKLNEFACLQRLDSGNRTGRIEDSDTEGYADLIRYNLASAGGVLFEENDIDIFTDGDQKFEALMADLEQAESFIHMQYYIIRNDVLFERIVKILERKAAGGVQVRILFDAMGCRSVGRSYWKRLREKGIQTTEFFPAFLKRLQLRINYRNHRKIVIVDNRVAYLGGFNIGREYLGLDDGFGYWRDTHMRIRGSAVLGLQLCFAQDWSYAAREELSEDITLFENAGRGQRDHCKIQIVSSGPDDPWQRIRDNYVRLIAKAKERICIQTPYFIPDEAMLNALLIAVRSGIEVRLMIPCKPDHPFIYWATYSYVGELVNAGAECYTYDNGFLHSKGIVVDGEVFCYGTANMDIRSFALNFEVNAVVYSRRKAEEMERIFREDLKECTRITKEVYGSRTLTVRFKEQVCRLLSPVL